MSANAAAAPLLYNSLPFLTPSFAPFSASHDLYRDLHEKGFLQSLLIDRATGKGLIWASETYSALGHGFEKTAQITPELIAGREAELANLRAKSRLARTRKHGEVMTPLSICEKMCDFAHNELKADLAHEDLGPEDLDHDDWKTNVDKTVLEITCGEAPFLVCRRDPQDGVPVPIEKRRGLLDRKLQAITQNATTKAEWLHWVMRAYQATYGYEFQGDNALLARINLLATFEDYMRCCWECEPEPEDYNRILDIISWNIWQMDGLTGTIPFGKPKRQKQCALFGASQDACETPPCIIKDWKADKIVTFISCGNGK